MSETREYVLIMVISFAFACALVVVIYFWQNRKDFLAIRKRAYPAPNHLYLGLRNQILEGSREKFSLAPTQLPTEPWAVVMDCGVTNGTASVVALSDGHASIYTSSGGGSLGGGQSHESIRKAAQKAVATAAEFQAQARLTTTYPLPKRGEVVFYLLTDAGVFTATAPERELRTNKHPLSALGNAMQEVVTGYRIIQTTSPG